MLYSFTRQIRSMRAAVGFAYHPCMLEHCGCSDKHPEKPERVTTILQRLEGAGLTARCKALLSEERLASDEELLAVHTEAHIANVTAGSEAVRAAPESRGLREPHGDGAIYFHEATEHSARAAAGSVLSACDAALSGKVRTAFALVRPPGHHAEAGEALGFCFYNSVAVAAAKALRPSRHCTEEPAGSGDQLRTAPAQPVHVPVSRRVERVAIVDWDVHHGNGTQHIFEADPNVLFISLHRFGRGFFPGTGALNEVGTAAGRGRTVNVPWMQAGLGDADYAAAFTLVVLPILREFAPDLLIISAGFDAALGDVQGKMRCSPSGFAWMTRQLFSLGGSCVPVVVFEGGYHLEASAACAEAVLVEMLAHFDDAAEAQRAPAAPTAGATAAVKAGSTAAVTSVDSDHARETPAILAEVAAVESMGGLGTLTETLLRQVLTVQREFWTSLRSDEHANAVEMVFNRRGPRGCRKRGR